MCGIGILIENEDDKQHQTQRIVVEENSEDGVVIQTEDEGQESAGNTSLKDELRRSLQRRGNQDVTNIGEVVVVVGSLLSSSSSSSISASSSTTNDCEGDEKIQNQEPQEHDTNTKCNNQCNSNHIRCTLMSSVLHLRGNDMVRQPLQQQLLLVDKGEHDVLIHGNNKHNHHQQTSSTNIISFSWNGECYGFDHSPDTIDHSIDDDIEQLNNKSNNQQEDDILRSNDTQFIFDQLVSNMTTKTRLEKDAASSNDVESKEEYGKTIANVLSKVHGEFSFIVMQHEKHHHHNQDDEENIVNVYFGRDWLGRRSLLMGVVPDGEPQRLTHDLKELNDNDHPLTENANVNQELYHFPRHIFWDTMQPNQKVIISSVAPSCSSSQLKWFEVPPGLVFRLSLNTGTITWIPIGRNVIPPCVPATNSIVCTNKSSSLPENICLPLTWNERCNMSNIKPSMWHAANELYQRLSSAVRKRVCYVPPSSATSSVEHVNDSDSPQKFCGSSPNQHSNVGILFSGGLDSVVLASLSHEHVPIHQTIDLINVAFYHNNKEEEAFDKSQQRNVLPFVIDTPDRAAALLAYEELCIKCPTRDWNFVAVDVHYSSTLKKYEPHILSLIYPKQTHMDFNIGAAMWFASRGQGISVRFKPQANEKNEETLDVEGSSSNVRVNEAMECTTEATNETNTRQSTRHTSTLTTRDMLSSMIRSKETEGRLRKVLPRIVCSKVGCTKHGHLQCLFQACTFCCSCYQKPINRFLGKGARLCSFHNGTFASNKSTKKHQNSSHTSNDICENAATYNNFRNRIVCTPYTSNAKVLLIGIGADEQMAGYGRHRSTYQRGGTEALRDELNNELSRLWKRNLGRDDRCISDHGKEARFPFLDEHVVSFLSELPLHDICDLGQNQPRGVGDKMILRLVAAAFTQGTTECSLLEKRAIQFGSRIAKLSDQYHAAATATTSPEEETTTTIKPQTTKKKPSGTSHYQSSNG